MNLLATQYAAPILGQRRLVLAPAVTGEALFIYADDAASKRLRIDKAFILGNSLEVLEVALDDRETAAYVKYAAQIDDGEAQAIAIAQERHLALLSDDNGAIRLAAKLGLTVETTLELAHAWAQKASISVVKQAMRALRRRANYAAPRTHPLRDWYLEMLDESG